MGQKLQHRKQIRLKSSWNVLSIKLELWILILIAPTVGNQILSSAATVPPKSSPVRTTETNNGFVKWITNSLMDRFWTTAETTTEITLNFDLETQTTTAEPVVFKDNNSGDDVNSDGNQVAQLPPVVSDIDVVNITEHSVTVNWTPKDDSNHTYCLKIFTLSDELKSNNVSSSPACNCTETVIYNSTWTFTNLKRFTQYTIILSEQIRNICGEESKKHVQTKKGVPEVYPDALNVLDVNATAFTIAWNVSRYSGHEEDLGSLVLDGFSVVFWESKNKRLLGEKKDIEKRKNSVYIGDLKPWTEYEVKVCAFNIEHDGQLHQTCSSNLQVKTHVSSPSAPIEFSTFGVTNTSIKTKWNQPEDPNGPIDGYILTIGANGQEYVTETTDGNKTEFTFSELIPWTKYFLNIRAFNNLKGEQTVGPEASATVRTKAGTPSAPVSFSASSVKSTQVKLSWNPPDDPNGPLDGYIITVNASDEVERNETVLGNVTKFTFPDLTPWTEYVFGIRAFNYLKRKKSERLEGPETSIFVKTSVGRPSAVQNLKAQQIGPGSVFLEWDPPANPNGPINGYTIKVNRSDGTLKSVTMPNTGTSYEVKDLKSWTFYAFTVSAFNRDVNGTELNVYGIGSTKVIRTEPDFPNQPNNVTAAKVTSNAVYLTWKYPFDYPGPLTYSVLVYQAWNSSCQTKSLVQNVTDGLDDHTKTATVIENLDPYTEYCFAVEATTSKGSSRSEWLLIQTESEFPEVPGGLKITGVYANKLHITWKKQKRFPGPTNYTIYATNYTECTCRRMQGNVYTEITIIGWNDTRAIVEPLSPYTDYCIVVLATTEAGTNCSENNKLKGRTHPSNPSPPRNVDAKTVNATAIELSWKSPETPNGPIDGYVISFEKEIKRVNATSSKRTNDVFCAVLTDLDPYKNYTIEIVAFNMLRNSMLKSDPIRRIAQTSVAVPNKPERVNITTTFDTATMEWSHPSPYPGPISYTVFVYNAWEGECQTSNQSTQPYELKEETSLTIQYLDPYTEYCFQIKAATKAGHSWSDEKVIRTQAGIPEDPEILEASPGAKNTHLRWKEPRFVGPTTYTVYVVKGNECNCPEDETNGTFHFITSKNIDGWDKTNTTIESLTPYTEYCMVVTAETDAARNCSNRSQVTLRTSPYIPEAPVGLQVNCSEESKDKAFLSWKPPVVTNGILELYNISFSKFQNDTGNITELHESANYVLVNASSNEGPLCCNATICEGYVEGLEWKSFYVFEVQAKTKDVEELGAEVKNFDCYIHELAPSADRLWHHRITGIISGLVFCLCVFILAAIAFVQRENIRKLLSSARGKTRPILAPIEVINLPSYGEARPVKIENFPSHVAAMLCDSSLRFSQEYEELRSTKFTYHATAAQLPENRQKNRWVNILPYDQSRVKLLPIDDDPGSDYINGSYIPGYSSPREYIATQGPLPGTLDDFWRMIWEQGVTMIVMLTQCVERGKKKCEQYWHSDHDIHCYGDLQVQMRSESILSGYTIRLFDIQLGDRQRVVKQMHFTRWPDFGCPENTELLINFVRAVRDHLPHTNVGPIVVHCSAGVGRTGTFIAVDRLLRHIVDHEYIDIFTTVLEMRQHRPNMVQTEDQYIYIHECIRDVLSETSKTRLSSRMSSRSYKDQTKEYTV